MCKYFFLDLRTMKPLITLFVNRKQKTNCSFVEKNTI